MPPGPVVERPSCTDAVIVLPGIMGSELVDAATGEVLWGVSDPSWYVSAWTSGRALRRLAVTDEERAGAATRVRARRLLAATAAVPVFHGVEPYTRLVAEVRRVAAHPAAVLPFPYDWRLSVGHNAAALRAAAERHLAQWRGHEYWRGRRHDPDSIRLSLVAHSMGGLVARRFVAGLGPDAPVVRTVVTLGTPFYGAVKAVHILGTGRGATPPLPRARLRHLVRDMPGLYDLLPSYRCVVDGPGSRRLAPADVAAVGGDAELAAGPLSGAERSWPAGGPALRPFVGVDQPTMQSLSITDGAVEPLYYTCEDGGAATVDHAGDATVFRRSAVAGEHPPSYVPQTHVALARSEEAVAFVRAVLTEGTLGPPLPGVLPIGLQVPDVAAVDVETEILVAVPDFSAVACRVVEVGTNTALPPPRLSPGDGVARARVRLPRPGIYRVEAKGGGYSAVSQLLLAVPAADLAPAAGPHRTG
ncbi:MAG TPA: hypothetical protein VFM55_14420 [Micromonosporaceae bacterium]|nr:hypothetical protein [Micromonosporaceae bacterium]